MSYFMVPLSLLGLGLPWKLHHVTYGTSDVMWLVGRLHVVKSRCLLVVHSFMLPNASFARVVVFV